MRVVAELYYFCFSFWKDDVSECVWTWKRRVFECRSIFLLFCFFFKCTRVCLDLVTIFHTFDEENIGDWEMLDTKLEPSIK